MKAKVISRLNVSTAMCMFASGTPIGTKWWKRRLSPLKNMILVRDQERSAYSLLQTTGIFRTWGLLKRLEQLGPFSILAFVDDQQVVRRKETEAANK